MSEYKPNSHKSKKEEVGEKKVEKVVSGKVVSKKKTEVQKFTDVFISEDVHNVKSYILMDVLVPAIKKALSDIVKNGIDMILYGEGASRTKRNSPASKVSYGSFYDDDPKYKRYNKPAYDRVKSGYDYDDIILATKGEAEEVLYRMDELVVAYGLVSVADFYELVGVEGRYTDNKYGWTDVRNAHAVRLRDGGYLIKLPKALPLD